MECLNPYSIGRYSLSSNSKVRQSNTGTVLILILLEDTLWGCHKASTAQVLWVLILILLEDTLWGRKVTAWTPNKVVLILILLEDTLWVGRKVGTKSKQPVLILILLEDTLWGVWSWFWNWLCRVLILILLEDTLWVVKFSLFLRLRTCLNPYSIGRYSLRYGGSGWTRTRTDVLILILLEDTLWAFFLCPNLKAMS